MPRDTGTDEPELVDTQQRLPACLKTEGSAPDYVVLYGGEPAREIDAGGFTDEGYVETEVRGDAGTRIRVAYDLDTGLKGVSAYDADDPDNPTPYEPADVQPDRGTHWEPESGDRAPIKIVPETEVPA